MTAEQIVHIAEVVQIIDAWLLVGCMAVIYAKLRHVARLYGLITREQ